MKARFDLTTVLPFLTLIGLIAVFSILNPSFLSLRNATTIGRQAVILLVAALGEMLAILAGGIDLSAIGIMSMSSVVLSLLVKNAVNTIDMDVLAIPISLLVACIFGVANGLLNSKAKVPSFMATLGTGYIGSGLAIFLYQGHPIRIFSGNIRALALGNVLGIPTIIIAGLLILLCASAFLRYFRIGRYIYALGGDERKLKFLGVNTDACKIITFVISALFFGAAGVLNAAREGAGTATIDSLMTLNIVAAVVIGGTPLTGGIGRPLNTLVGVLILAVLNNGMILVSANQFIQNAIIGVVAIFAVALTFDRSKIGIIK